jgi:hypothetical protein
VPADLEDGDRLGRGDLGAQAGDIDGGGDDGEHIVARRQRPAECGGRGGERTHSGHHLDAIAGMQALVEIHEAAVEERIALAQHGDVAAVIEAGGDGLGGLVVGRAGGGAVGAHRHREGQFLGAFGNEPGGDAPGHAVAVACLRVGDDGDVREDAGGLDGDKLRVAGADAEAVENAGHALTARHWVTPRRGRMVMCWPTGSA